MFATYLQRELLRRKRQTLLVAAALGLAVGLVIMVVATTAGVRTAQDKVLGSLYGVGTDLTVTRTIEAPNDGNAQFQFGPPDQSQQRQRVNGSQLMMRPGSQTLSDSTINKVSSVDGVSSVVGVLALDSVNLDGTLGRSPQSSGGAVSGQPPSGQGQAPQSGSPTNISVGVDSVNGVDTTTTTTGPLSSAAVVDGRGFTSADSDALVAQVDQTYATANDVLLGDKIDVGSQSFKVIGVVESTNGSESTAADIYIPLTKAQGLAYLKGKVSTLYVQASSSDQIKAVSSSISNALPSVTVSTSADLADQVSGSLSSAATLISGMARWLTTGVVLVALLLAALLTLSSVSRRMREFGTLKAVGWPSRRVVGQVMGEAGVQGLLGGLVGVAVGLAGIAVINAVAPELSASLASFGGPTGGPGGGPDGPIGADQSLASVVLHASAPPTLLISAVALAVVGALVAGSFGGWRTSRLRPAVALRSVE